MHKIGQSRGFLGNLLDPLLKTYSSLVGNALAPLAKSILIPLGLTAAASETNADPLGLALHMITSIISNEEMNENN